MGYFRHITHVNICGHASARAHAHAHKHTHSHTQTWLAGLVDLGQQLNAALIVPVVEDPGHDVEVTFWQGVFEEVSYGFSQTHTRTHANTHTHTHTHTHALTDAHTPIPQTPRTIGI